MCQYPDFRLSEPGTSKKKYSVPFLEFISDSKIIKDYLKRGEKREKGSMVLQFSGSISHVTVRRPGH